MLKAKRAAKAAPEISFEDAVAEGKALIASADRNDWRLAELADQVDTIYGENKLAEFATKIGLAHCTIKRRRSTFRNWKDILKGDPGLLSSLSYSTARELETHPDRARLIKENPKMSKRQATACMKAFHNKPESQTKRRWNDLLKRAGKAIADENFLKLDPQILLDVVEPSMLATIRDGAQAWIRLADGLEKLEPANEADILMAPRKNDGAWWDATWNTMGGCRPISAGCLNCYASRNIGTLQESLGVPIYRGTTEFKGGRHRFNGTLLDLPPGQPAMGLSLALGRSSTAFARPGDALADLCERYGRNLPARATQGGDRSHATTTPSSCICRRGRTPSRLEKLIDLAIDLSANRRVIAPCPEPSVYAGKLAARAESAITFQSQRGYMCALSNALWRKFTRRRRSLMRTLFSSSIG